MEEAYDDAELPVEDTGTGDVEAVYVHSEEAEEIGGNGNGHAGPGEGGEADDVDDRG